MGKTRRRSGVSRGDWVREFLHWAISEWRISLLVLGFGIVLPLGMFGRALTGEPFEIDRLAIFVLVFACGVGFVLLTVSNRLAVRSEAREVLATQSFVEAATELGAERVPLHRFNALASETPKSVRNRSYGPEELLDAFALTTRGREVTVYALEPRAGDVGFRAIAATQVGRTFSPASFQSAPLMSWKRKSGYPGVTVRLAGDQVSDHLLGWVADQEHGQCFYVEGRWALLEVLERLSASNIATVAATLAEFAELIDSDEIA